MRNRPKLPLERLLPFEAPLPPAGQRWNFAALFGSNRPVELEIGFGKGAFLVAAASQRPETHFLGIEIDRGLERYVASRMARRNLTNVKVICGDAARIVADAIPDLSLTCVHAYCPDPWWKKRHHKRRLFQPSFVRELERSLIQGGHLLVATDVAASFVRIVDIIISASNLVPVRPPATVATTNFAAKAEKRGKTVWQSAFVKPS